MKKIFLLVSFVSLSLIIISCPQPTEPEKATLTYTVTFYANGGSGTMAAQIFTEDVAQALTENGFTVPSDKPAFSHWNTKNDGTGKTYTNGETITITQNTDLYAIWADYTLLSDFTINNGVITAYNGNDSVVHIHPSITGIAMEAFKDCASLKSITIPNSVTSIGDSAFKGCSSLQSITIPDSVTTIEYGTFNDCTNLRSVTIPNSVTTIKNIAFASCGNLQTITIPNSVENIGGFVFQRAGLQHITIPNSVTSIANDAFYGCGSLESITVDSDNANYESKDGVLYNKGKTEILQYPNSKQGAEFTIPSSVTTIEAYSFEGSNNLESIIIGNSVTTIEGSAFRYCESLVSLTIPDTVTVIGGSIFDGSFKFKTVFTNYTKEADGSRGGEKPYPDGWSNVNNGELFKATWVPIPVTP